MPQQLFVTFLLSLMLAQPAQPFTFYILQPSRWTLTLVNSSGFNIYAIYLSSSETNIWGRDLLGPTQIVEDGDRFTVTDIRTGEYDVRLVDQDGDECELRHIQITQDEEWQITQKDLLKCEFH